MSAALALSLKDYELRGNQRWIIGEEKGSKRHEMLVHPSLETIVDEYIEFVGFTDPTTPLFQSSNARGGKLTGRMFDRTPLGVWSGAELRLLAFIEILVITHSGRQVLQHTSTPADRLKMPVSWLIIQLPHRPKFMSLFASFFSYILN